LVAITHYTKHFTQAVARRTGLRIATPAEFPGSEHAWFKTRLREIGFTCEGTLVERWMQCGKPTHKKGLAGPASSATAKNPASTESQASPVGGHQQDESGAGVSPAPSEADQLAELDRQADQLSGRETAISASLDTLQRQQNAHGLQLRGAIIAAQSRMRTYLAKAQAGASGSRHSKCPQISAIGRT